MIPTQAVEQEIEYVQKSYDVLIEFFINYSFQIVGALIIFIIGWQVARWVGKLILRLCEKYNLDITLSRFFANVAKYVIVIVTIIVCMGKFGIQLTPLIAGIGAAALGASLAIQGLLSNYAAGLSIIMTRPFKVGDTLTVQNYNGVVHKINLDRSELITEDQEVISIPNKHFVGEILINSWEYKIVESTIGIAYDSDPAKAVQVLEKTLAGFDKIATEPKPLIGIENFGDSSIDLGIRYWAPTREYFQTQYQVNLAFYDALKTAGITIPFPQREITILNTEKEAS